MRKLTIVGLAILLSFFVTACGSTIINGHLVGTTSHAPTGIPCKYEVTTDTWRGYVAVCVYYQTKDGKLSACSGNSAGVGVSDICPDTKDSFFYYDPDNNNTYYCDSGSHKNCEETDNNPVNPPSTITASTTCPTPSFAYSNLVNESTGWVVADEEVDQNTTQTTATATFSSKKSTTTSITLNVDMQAYANAILGVVFAGVQAKVNFALVKTSTAAIGNSFSAQIPPNSTIHAIYGIKMQVTSGHLYMLNPCGSQKYDQPSAESRIPIAPGWCVWIDDNNVDCPILS
jgi:hypothetical protein